MATICISLEKIVSDYPVIGKERITIPFKFYYIRLVRYYKKYGFLQSVRRIIEKFNKSSAEIVYLYNLTQFNENDLQNPQNIKIESKTNESQINKDELDVLIEHIGKEIILTQLEERFAQKAVLWIIKYDGNFAGYLWSVTRSKKWPYYFPLGDDVFLFDGFVFPQYRGRNIYPQLIKSILYDAKRKGLNRAIIDAYLWNTAAHKSILKAGMKILGIVRRYRLCGCDFIAWKR